MFFPECDLSKPYAKGSYNKYNDQEQWVRLSEGCPNCCPFCRESYENPDLKILPMPVFVRNDIKILDMNFLSHPEALSILKDFEKIRVNNKVVRFHFLCGIDFRFLNEELAFQLKRSRFYNIKIAWDFGIGFQRKIKKSIDLLFKAGFRKDDITIFMICNWKIPYKDNLFKLDLCKVWGVKVAECYFDNQLSPNIKPIHWKEEEIKDFRKRVRKHNHLINFGIDPELEANNNLGMF